MPPPAIMPPCPPGPAAGVAKVVAGDGWAVSVAGAAGAAGGISAAAGGAAAG